jgi:hypothetical protein
LAVNDLKEGKNINKNNVFKLWVKEACKQISSLVPDEKFIWVPKNRDREPQENRKIVKEIRLPKQNRSN